MKTTRTAVWIASAILLWAVGTPLVEGGWSRRVTGPDPNAADQISSPFRGQVVSLTANTVGVRGEANTKLLGLDSSKKTHVRTIYFVVKDGAKIMRDGKECKVADIQKGDSAVVTFSCKKGSTLRKVTTIDINKGSGSNGQQ